MSNFLFSCHAQKFQPKTSSTFLRDRIERILRHNRKQFFLNRTFRRILCRKLNFDELFSQILTRKHIRSYCQFFSTNTLFAIGINLPIVHWRWEFTVPLPRLEDYSKARCNARLQTALFERLEENHFVSVTGVWTHDLPTRILFLPRRLNFWNGFF